MKKRPVRSAARKRARPVRSPATPAGGLLETSNPEVLWALATSLPAVRNLVALGWHRFLPPQLATTFIGCAVAVKSGYRGGELWKELGEFIEGVLRVKPDEEMGTKSAFLDKRFQDYYGEYENTPMGLVKVLIDLGLVALQEQDGQDVMEIPEQLPTPEKRLNLCAADRGERVVLKARYREDGGPRQRVTYEDVPAIRRMFNAGWARHLPPDIAIAFMVTAAVSVGRCTGSLMWENIEDLWKAHREHEAPLMPKRKEIEVEARFREEYGKPFIRTARGAVEVLLDLGLLALTQVDGRDYLEVPEVLPTPDMRLYLSEEERRLLAERLKIKV